MDLNEIIQELTEKAKVVVDEEIQAYQKEHPEALLGSEEIQAVRSAVLSQLTIQLSQFTKPKDMEIKDAFDRWFAENEEEHLKKACKNAIAKQAELQKTAKGRPLSRVEEYMKRYLGEDAIQGMEDPKKQ